MILSDRDIKKYIREGVIGIIPFIEKNIKASSVDLTLNNTVKVCKSEKVDLLALDDQSYENIDISDGFWLEPGKIVLGSCNEIISVPENMCLTIHNRSSFARAGIDVSASSYANLGYRGTLPLAIYNRSSSSIKLVANMRICQVTFNLLTSTAENPYNKQTDQKYHNEKGISIAKLHLDDEIRKYIESKGLDNTKSDYLLDLSKYLDKQIKESSKKIVSKIEERFGEADEV